MVDKRCRFARFARLGAPLILMVPLAWTSFGALGHGEMIGVLASDCVSKKTVFTLGDKVCAIAIGAPLEPAPPRRFEWIAPNGTIFQLGPNVDSDPDSNSITLPVAGPFAQPGTWMVKTVDVSNNGTAVSQFLVQDLNKAAADLSASMFAPFQVSAGANVTFTLMVKNNGPNEAHNVQIKIGAATNSTILSAEQAGGLPFTWVVSPLGGDGGIGAIDTLPVNAEAAFVFVYRIDPGTPNGASVSSTAIVSSSTFELHPADNVGTATSLLAAQPCAITCPAAITTQKQPGQCGAVASFATPSHTGSNCGALVCNPASGSFFPTGTTSVICVGNSGSPCSFTVTVDDPQPPALTCPSDITVTEASPGMGLAVVRYQSPTVNDNCAAEASACAPPSGSSFPLGATTVACQTRNAWGDKATCSFTVTVESDCSLICPSSIAGSNKRNECGAVINYPTPKTTDNCGSVKCTPPSGSVFPIGETTVSCITTKGSSSTFTVTIQDTQAPLITEMSAIPALLFPMNHKMRDVTIDYAKMDNCSGAIICTLSVSSDEPNNQKDASRDWEIVDAHHVRLRAERTGKDTERTYSITINCRDAGGNASNETVKVVVPRDRR